MIGYHKIPPTNISPPHTEIYINWDYILSACRYLIHTSDITNSAHILGLTRGGLIPATMLSNKLQIPMTPVSYSSKQGNGEFKGYDNKIPSLTLPENSTIYIIDDLTDTGNTMNEVVDLYKKLGYAVKSMVIHHKESSIHTPDYFYSSIPQDSGWIIYPWENF